MSKVFVVTSGEYSEYRISAVCSTIEKAEEAKRFFNSDNGIEEWTVDDVPFRPDGFYLWSVVMDREGNNEVERENTTYDITHEWQPTGWDTDEPRFGWRVDTGKVSFMMFAKDEQHAIKIANEKRLQLIASGEWTTNRAEWNRRRQERGG